MENLADGLRLAVASPNAVEQVFVMADEGAPTWRSTFSAFARALGVTAQFPPVPWAPLHGIAWALEQTYGRLHLRGAPPLTRYRVDLMRRDYHFSSEKARRVLGYTPTVRQEEAVRRTVAWVDEEWPGD